MSEVLTIVLWTLAAGITIPIGAAFATIKRIGPNWLEEEFKHFVIAFGGGALISAVALVLIPEGIKELSIPSTALFFLGGGITFLVIDYILDARKTRGSQLVAMLADFVPEAIALGATFTADSKVGSLLAILIALQNLPEGFNAFREINSSTTGRPLTIIAVFVGLAFLGPVCGLLGFWWLSDSPTVISALMVFAAGGILFIIFQDIAPQARLKKHWAPPLGAVFGFLLGLIANMMIGG